METQRQQHKFQNDRRDSPLGMWVGTGEPRNSVKFQPSYYDGSGIVTIFVVQGPIFHFIYINDSGSTGSLARSGKSITL